MRELLHLISKENASSWVFPKELADRSEEERKEFPHALSILVEMMDHKETNVDEVEYVTPITTAQKEAIEKLLGASKGDMEFIEQIKLADGTRIDEELLGLIQEPNDLPMTTLVDLAEEGDDVRGILKQAGSPMSGKLSIRDLD